MGTEGIEQVAEVPSAKSLGGSRVKNTKKISSSVRPCVYFKDMECRIPMCDMDICQKCTEGRDFCMRITFIKNMIQKVLMIIMAIIIFIE